MAIKPNSLDPLNPIREFVLENAGTGGKEIDYDRELYELLGNKSSFVISACSGEITKLLRPSKDISDEERAKRLREILCDSNDGVLTIGQRAEKVLESIDISEKKLKMSKLLVQGKINREIRNRVTLLLNKLDGIATGNSAKA